METFRQRLLELMREIGCDTAISFAKVLGLTRQSVGFYLNGDRVPDSKTLRQICERCKVSADWLLGLSDVRTLEQDFQTACKTFSLSETAGRTLLENASPTLNAFLSLPVWHKMLDCFLMFQTCKENIVKDTDVKIDIYQNGTVHLSCASAATYYANMTSKMLEVVLLDEIDRMKGESEDGKS